MKISIPLAEFLRAQTLDEIVGQENILAPEGLIRQSIESAKPLSILLWGPPGVGKTTIARLYAQAFSNPCLHLSAVFSGIADIKKIIRDQESSPLFSGSTIIMLDEIHRFNRAQQDALLPHVENGSIVLIGATTENPSFYLNGALLSRMRVLQLEALGESDLAKLLSRYESRFSALPITKEARLKLLKASLGDGRYLFNLIENLQVYQGKDTLGPKELTKLLPIRSALYDRASEQHYNLISALHKSVRSSDPDAALYWFSRMLEGGEDPLFIARRLIRMASEDIGLADKEALGIAVAARESFKALGSPEGELALAQVVIYLSLSPKSNSVYTAFNKAKTLAKSTSHLSPPKHILNAPTTLMKELDYGADYIYDHDTEQGCSGANNFPEALKREALYQPVERGFEREMKKRLEYFNNLRQNISLRERE